jgi:hypothetical protein
MSPKDLLRRVRQRPFSPFRLIISEGGSCDIRHPEQLMVARESAVIGLEGGPGDDFYETTVLVDLVHVVRLEPLPAAAPAKGDGAGPYPVE